MNTSEPEKNPDPKFRNTQPNLSQDNESDDADMHERRPGSRHEADRRGGRRRPVKKRWEEGEDSPLLEAAQDCMG
jgi:hypothetical protein